MPRKLKCVLLFIAAWQVNPFTLEEGMCEEGGMNKTNKYKLLKNSGQLAFTTSWDVYLTSK